MKCFQIKDKQFMADESEKESVEGGRGKKRDQQRERKIILQLKSG